ncbi:branched-chain amino acid aminotransferase [Amaricoccus sp.]|uniref:branched-chain amino acid aminotransferase n=1 Tax=Amaricoccus sp. TaxID=1872485 RepID=UPI001B5B1605|nr:branched-chain amino acid aminotransferase [Amaricoccus sp.]MBP6999969.1 branched-chain amino acid aminotransferase [Amaricoccus sp.]
MALGKSIATWVDGRWHDGDLKVMRAADHGAWQGTLVFDGARAFEGVTPDLDRHCARIVRSAAAMGMEAPVAADEIAEIILEGVARWPAGAQLYLRPMMWSQACSASFVDPLPGSTAFVVCIEEIPMGTPGAPMALTVSPFRRPRPDMALTEAKAGCLYANNGRIVSEARKRGFHNALSLDVEGHVAETAMTNVFMVRDGVVLTPVPNGMFLAGITRARVIDLLRADGVEVAETALTVADFEQAHEIFVTGNANKVMPATRFEARELPSAAMAAHARALYWDFAHQTRKAA